MQPNFKRNPFIPQRKVAYNFFKDVEEDAEAVARAIARELNLEYEFRPRQATGSGLRRINTKPKR